jgi:mycofactocin system creatininase family protein
VTSLASLRWPDVAAFPDRLLVVPVGATEQHGPHLPLETDTVLAVALAEALGRERDDVLVAPAVAYGSSGEHQGFPGTLSIGAAVTERLLVELARSATESFPRVLFLSTHGGNAEPLRAAVGRLRGEGRDVRAWGPEWGGDAHAGASETSLMLAIAPEAVDAARLERGDTRPVDELLPELRRTGVRGVSPNGVLGDATVATADHGRTALRRATERLLAFVAAWPPAPTADR